MFPSWFHILSAASLLLGAACALLLSIQVIRHPQHMTVMNIVWPVSALFGTVLIFATNTHHLFIAGFVGSYELIAPARPLIAADFTELAIRTLGDSFMLGIQLSAPVIVFALIFNLAAGLVGRVMPAFQIFFAAAPLSIILGLSIFALSLGVLGTVFIDRYRALANLFVSGGVGG